MNMWQQNRSYRGSQGKDFSRFARKIIRGVGEIIVGLSCVVVIGCSSPPESTSGPSKEDIRSDADRFFEKMEKERQGKPEKKP